MRRLRPRARAGRLSVADVQDPHAEIEALRREVAELRGRLSILELVMLRPAGTPVVQRESFPVHVPVSPTIAPWQPPRDLTPIALYPGYPYTTCGVAEASKETHMRFDPLVSVGAVCSSELMYGAPS